MTQEVKPDPSVSVPTESRPNRICSNCGVELFANYQEAGWNHCDREMKPFGNGCKFDGLFACAGKCQCPANTEMLEAYAASSSLLPVGRQKFAVVRYTNYKGQTANRSIVPVRIYFGSTEQHPEEQWLLDAFDLGRNAARTFAMKDMQWNPADTEGLPNRESCDWNHNLCRDCWEWIRPDDVPCAIKPEYASEETCCLCGEKHSSGIYIRRDPKKMPCGKPRSQFALASASRLR